MSTRSSRFPWHFDWQAPDGGCVAYPRYPGAEGVETCTRLVEEAGVLLLPASIYRSDLTPTPVGRFRIGIGRAHPERVPDAFASWMRDHR